VPLAAGSLLAPHFTAHELGADDPTASGTVLGNLRTTADYLERVRGILGVPLQVTSGYRPPSHPLSVAEPNSDHPRGLAADVVPLGVSQYGAWQQLTAARDAGTLPAWDQLIFYPLEGHIHIGLGERRRGEVRVKVLRQEGGTYLAPLDAQLVQTLRGYAPSLVLLLLVALVALFTLYPKWLTT